LEQIVRKPLALLSIMGGLALGGAAAGQGKPPIDRNVLHVQVVLDHLGFSPGILDGRSGQSLAAALRGFQEARGLAVTGEIDQPTIDMLNQHRGWTATKTLRVSAAILQGPFAPTPKSPTEQSKLPALGYASPEEKLAEKFHTTPAVLAELNPGVQLAPGARLVFPNALPTSRAYPADIKPEWRATLNDLNVTADVPKADHIVVDESDGVLRVFDAANALVAQFSATMGSEHDPLPIGAWKIVSIDTNPKFRYNPDLFWDAKPSDRQVMLPPGPNGPVGVVWLGLDKPHYGIHGTPEPQLIGRTESHGCIRLTNWDAARLALMVKIGTPAIFQE
jgi:lipoprotein-anchoring transpeptidase ErfK/SrfK